MNPHSLLEWFQAGGWMMYPILACSLLGLAVTIERLLVIGVAGYGFTRKTRKLRQAVLTQAPAEFFRQEQHPPTIQRLLEVGEQNWGNSNARLQEALTVSAHKAKRHLEAHLNTLSVISQATPLMGLLGTVWGMVQAFQALQQAQGAVNPTTLAGGIWVSLLTTVFGLIVAIPAYLAWHTLEQTVDQRLEVIEEFIGTLLTVHEECHDD